MGGWLSGSALVAALTVAVIAAPATAQVPERDRLARAEVLRLFVDKEWSNGTGRFLFARDGTYRYDEPGFSARGTWGMDERGMICTVNRASNQRTCYTFARDGGRYRYWHDRSARFVPAIPG